MVRKYHSHISLLFLTIYSFIFVTSQVALMVAAEFWEQGDLERTVLDQQPIVRSLKCVFYSSVWIYHVVAILQIIISSLSFSPWWTEIMLMNFPRCNVVSLTLSAPLSTRYVEVFCILIYTSIHSYSHKPLIPYVYVCVCVLAGVCSLPQRDPTHVWRAEYQQGRVESSSRCARGQDEGHRRWEEEAGRRRRWALGFEIFTVLAFVTTSSLNFSFVPAAAPEAGKSKTCVIC